MSSRRIIDPATPADGLPRLFEERPQPVLSFGRHALRGDGLGGDRHRARGRRPHTSGISAFAAATPSGAADRSSLTYCSTAASSSRGGDDRVDEPDLSGARAAGKRMPVRNSSRAADGPIFAQHERRDHRRQDAELGLGEAEDCASSAHDDVADGGETGAAAERGAVDAADRRQPAACRSRGTSRAIRARVARRSPRASSRPSAPSSAASAPALNTLPGAGEHDDAQRRDRARRSPAHAGQLGDDVVVERVADVGPVQRQVLDGAPRRVARYRHCVRS